VWNTVENQYDHKEKDQEFNGVEYHLVLSLRLSIWLFP
jgi:hypothetical protein